MHARPFLGLRTCLVHVPDLDDAKAWYAEVVGFQPYFDEPYYVGFEIGGYELGLVPNEAGLAPRGAVHAYWGVEDAPSAYARLLEQGAKPLTEPADVVGEIVVASVLDPWDNPFGVIQNPNFRLP